MHELEEGQDYAIGFTHPVIYNVSAAHCIMLGSIFGALAPHVIRICICSGNEHVSSVEWYSWCIFSQTWLDHDQYTDKKDMRGSHDCTLRGGYYGCVTRTILTHRQSCSDARRRCRHCRHPNRKWMCQRAVGCYPFNANPLAL